VLFWNVREWIAVVLGRETEVVVLNSDTDIWVRGKTSEVSERRVIRLCMA